MRTLPRGPADDGDDGGATESESESESGATPPRTGDGSDGDDGDGDGDDASDDHSAAAVGPAAGSGVTMDSWVVRWLRARAGAFVVWTVRPSVHA
jgi:hypothetical protein